MSGRTYTPEELLNAAHERILGQYPKHILGEKDEGFAIASFNDGHRTDNAAFRGQATAVLEPSGFVRLVIKGRFTGLLRGELDKGLLVNTLPEDFTSRNWSGRFVERMREDIKKGIYEDRLLIRRFWQNCPFGLLLIRDVHGVGVLVLGQCLGLWDLGIDASEIYDPLPKSLVAETEVVRSKVVSIGGVRMFDKVEREVGIAPKTYKAEALDYIFESFIRAFPTV